ncbi:hypothetical protein M378DRAFT_644969 [Amanita muscaria Koide BX008]|uniref:Uncharacterized protein n=1 Tax=Amanita muscaria (strain Koide BX008) TaxID=946122 RepID=A0A0C2RY39_AMAMK|nr:hypothetical protein M378DRAFT_644969 [Amanita muscaria Koide BX008]
MTTRPLVGSAICVKTWKLLAEKPGLPNLGAVATTPNFLNRPIAIHSLTIHYPSELKAVLGSPLPKPWLQKTQLQTPRWQQHSGSVVSCSC